MSEKQKKKKKNIYTTHNANKTFFFLETDLQQINYI